MNNIIGIDIGGTKTAIIVGSDSPSIFEKKVFKTLGPNETINEIIKIAREYKSKYKNISAIGISCGGPLSSKEGLILSPPNLPGWDNINICSTLSKEIGIDSYIENDANACALAEYLYGAGVGYSNVAFLTFGTGLGAGLILDKKLYRGTNDMAGEVGHIRLNDTGPIGYGKVGSFEGFCSGGGIMRLAKIRIEENSNKASVKEFLDFLAERELTTYELSVAAKDNNEFALSIFEESGYYLGKGLSILIDILNLECIIIGSIYARMERYIKPSMTKVLETECLQYSLDVCKIIPAKLGEEVGDYASLSVAMYCSKRGL